LEWSLVWFARGYEVALIVVPRVFDHIHTALPAIIDDVERTLDNMELAACTVGTLLMVLKCKIYAVNSCIKI